MSGGYTNIQDRVTGQILSFPESNPGKDAQGRTAHKRGEQRPEITWNQGSLGGSNNAEGGDRKWKSNTINSRMGLPRDAANTVEGRMASFLMDQGLHTVVTDDPYGPATRKQGGQQMTPQHFEESKMQRNQQMNRMEQDAAMRHVGILPGGSGPPPLMPRPGNSRR
mmetsp:Transcript_14598/g.47917  ORF Transcript_14598/g.47917 Transcript_14598/m.47917 type:complete len:166 (+) Transcript_14598:57-554(+)